MESATGQLAPQLVLAGDRGLDQQVLNGGVALLFHEVFVPVFAWAVFNVR
jgi:hypothetical protein